MLHAATKDAIGAPRLPTDADAVQAAREAVRMLKKRGYRANDAVKA